jgi:hypothetical protein
LILFAGQSILSITRFLPLRIGCFVNHMDTSMTWNKTSLASLAIALVIGVIPAIVSPSDFSAAVGVWCASPFICYALLVKRLPHFAYGVWLGLAALAELTIIVQCLFFPQSSTDPIGVLFVPAFIFLPLNLPPLIHWMLRVMTRKDEESYSH